MTWETIGFVLYGAIGLAIAGWHFVKVWPHLTNEPTPDAFTLSGLSTPREAAVRDHLLLFGPLWPMFLLTFVTRGLFERWFTKMVMREVDDAMARAKGREQ